MERNKNRAVNRRDFLKISGYGLVDLALFLLGLDTLLSSCTPYETNAGGGGSNDSERADNPEVKNYKFPEWIPPAVWSVSGDSSTSLISLAATTSQFYLLKSFAYIRTYIKTSLCHFERSVSVVRNPIMEEISRCTWFGSK